MIRIDFHTHTYHSYDSSMKPEKILERARANGLTHIVVNDHNTIAGGLECQKIAHRYGVKVIVGSEIKTDIGDVTGIFLSKEIPQGSYIDVIKAIKEQGGLSILNHPFVGHNLSGVDFSLFDLIEGYNGRCTAEQNERALALAKKVAKPICTGSDAHCYAEVGRNYSVFVNEDLTQPATGHHYDPAHAYYRIVSQLIKSVKKRDPVLMLKVILSAPRKFLKK